uniref:Coatomer subunit gamma n=1 Tax=Leptocylindrus danicus TaxID=163516 RepID=A0A6U2N3F3_9STRA
MGADPNNLLTGVEATEVFFGVTKLFMSDDASLRRMVYLFIKEVAETCNPDDVIIVTSSLTKDMTCDVDLYRANALRVLSRIIDASMLGAIERYVKSAIVDASPQVASAALVSALHLIRDHNAKGGATGAITNPNATANFNIVKRWISEITTASSSSDKMVQFHALLLLYQIKKQDRLGVRKLVSSHSSQSSATSRSSYQQSQGASPLTKVLLVRYTLSLISGNNILPRDDDEWRSHYAYLESLLRDKSEMVVFEAAKAICLIPNTDSSDLQPAIHALQLFLSSPKPTIRFAAIQVLSALSDAHPRAVSKCNEDLEALIGDPNRSVSTLAISTLLKTGSESSIERYLKQISGLLTDIPDEYKIPIIHSIRTLCTSYPHKHATLISFLANFLRDEGGFEFKHCIVNTIETLMHTIPDVSCKETALLHLCEFIEDCEFVQLSTHILHLLGNLGPSTTQPSRYIRFLYNRVILEVGCVRSAAVCALGKFGLQCKPLRASVLGLLKASLCDEDDETRDRATLYVTVLQQALEEDPYEPSAESNEEEDYTAEMKNEENQSEAASILLEPMPMSFDQLERALTMYAAAPSGENDSEVLTFDVLPVVEDHHIMDPSATTSAQHEMLNEFDAINNTNKAKTPTNVNAAANVYAQPELAQFGRVFRSTPVIQLTESETEYVVTCIKHILPEHIILEFNILNTLDDQLLQNVTVELQSQGQGVYDPVAAIPCDRIAYGDTAQSFVVLQRVSEGYEDESFDCELKFTVISVDPDTQEEISADGYEEEYPLEQLDIATKDFMAAKTTVVDFRKSWEGLQSENEVLNKFVLSYKSVSDAIQGLVSSLGMAPVDGTDVVASGNNKPHMLHLAGQFVMGNALVLARAQMVLDAGGKKGVVLKIAIRSGDEDGTVAKLVADCIR